MIIDKKMIRSAVLGPFRHAGWKKRGQASMYSVGPDLGVIVNVQKSPYGGQHYINVGFWFLEDGDERIPIADNCPVSRRLERICADAHELLVRATNTKYSSQEQIDLLSDYVDKVVVPKLTALLSRSALRESIENGSLGSGLVTLEAKQILNLLGK